MKTNFFIPSMWMVVAMVILGAMVNSAKAGGNFLTKAQQPDTTSFAQFKGTIVDSQTNEPLVFATLNISNSNIGTVCNSDGEFLLKVPKSMFDQKITVSYTGYKSKEFTVLELKERNRIKLDQVSVSLAEINVFPKDPNYLIRAVMGKRVENYSNSPALMTAFYRETIKKGRTYVSLSEAVVEVLKQSYAGARPDMVKLFKGRKSADYTKLDTLTFKLMGGPYATLMLDMMKNPYLIFTNDILSYYDFSLTNITRIDDKLVYVLDFKQKAIVDEPLFFGKLFIDSESLAMTSASFNLNVDNKAQAAEMMIRKKPVGADVYPTEATYLVNYREKDGKWYYSYSRGQINFKVKWDKKLFNTSYYTTIEMAVTDWENVDEKSLPASERLKQNVIMENELSGFADPAFWGEYNVIEPEQPIEAAIKKIQKKIEK
ncbi:MAG: carboxypeptidase-like regulatory domain-containing protein [Breznakibacter sp.]